MKSKQKAQRQLKKEFKAARAQYEALQKRWERAWAKAEKRARKLRKLEVKLAEMERHLHPQNGASAGQPSEPPQTLRQALLVFKPPADSNDQGAAQLTSLVTCLQSHGIAAQTVVKTSGKQVRAAAKEAVENKIELVIVAAGDGTIEDVAVPLVGTQTALGVIPIGTMNNLARGWGIPLQVEDACTLLGVGLTRAIDVGRVNINEDPKAEYFLETAGVGLSAIVIPAGQAAEKRQWTLLPKALRKLFDSQPTSLTLKLDDGQVIELKSQVVTVSNAPLLGKNIMIAPEAKMDDGQLDIATYEDMGKTDLLGYFMSASDGKLAHDPRVIFHRAKRVRIRSDQPVDAHSDKDVIEGQQVLDIGIMPQALRVVVGKGIALSLPIDNVPSTPPLTGKQTPAATKPKDTAEGPAEAAGAPA
ncbi:MAG: YegS/Rv2252/BmrU family lipid kinase [Chloroflexota bacterium]